MPPFCGLLRGMLGTRSQPEKKRGNSSTTCDRLPAWKRKFHCRRLSNLSCIVGACQRLTTKLCFFSQSLSPSQIRLRIRWRALHCEGKSWRSDRGGSVLEEGGCSTMRARPSQQHVTASQSVPSIRTSSENVKLPQTGHSAIVLNACAQILCDAVGCRCSPQNCCQTPSFRLVSIVAGKYVGNAHLSICVRLGKKNAWKPAVLFVLLPQFQTQ